MTKRLVDGLSYSNVVATLALFVALGGASYAAIKVPSNSVGSKQIKANAVKNAELADGSVTTAKIAANAVGPSQVADGSVTGSKIAGGAVNSANIAPSAVRSQQVGDGSIQAQDLAPPEAWHEVGPASASSDLCADPANTGVFCTLTFFDPDQPWANLGSGYATAAFYKDQLGIVRLRGLVRNDHLGFLFSGSYNFPIFRLPPGYRPDSTRLFTTNGKVRDLEVSVGRIDVAPNGLVTLIVDCRVGDIECSAHGDFVSLDGISFRPDE